MPNSVLIVDDEEGIRLTLCGVLPFSLVRPFPLPVIMVEIMVRGFENRPIWQPSRPLTKSSNPLAGFLVD